MTVKKIGLAVSVLVVFAAIAMPVSAGVLTVSLSNAPALPATPVSALVPDLNFSYYVPQAGAPAAPLEGTDAIRFFRACPNNDGGSSLPNNARIKVVVRDGTGRGIPAIAAADICILLNGGTATQGFAGVGADSVIANSAFNPTPLCPDVRCVAADAPTNATGQTYITFTGADAANPGVGVRDATRKWGHYDTELPVYVLGLKLAGRLTTGEPNGTYTLRIKNYDWTGGLGVTLNQGEMVSGTDFNITAHLSHNCAVPYP